MNAGARADHVLHIIAIRQVLPCQSQDHHAITAFKISHHNPFPEVRLQTQSKLRARMTSKPVLPRARNSQ